MATRSKGIMAAKEEDEGNKRAASAAAVADAPASNKKKKNSISPLPKTRRRSCLIGQWQRM